MEGDKTSLFPLLNKGGGHRVQRVPPNERRGRVHSSTVTVAVLEEQALNPVYQQRSERDFSISFFSGSGIRGDKRRTYRSQDNTVTDHTTGKTARMSTVMKGGFEALWK